MISKCNCCDSNDTLIVTKTSFFDMAVRKCQECSYHFLDYDKSNFNLAKYYEKDYWKVFQNIENKKNIDGKINPGYLVKNLPKPIQVFVELIGVRKSLSYSQYRYIKPFLHGKKLLEIGCGEGFLLELFEKKGFDVFGVEPSKENISLIQKKLHRGKCIDGYIEDLKNYEQKFDIIILSHVFEHLENCDDSMKILYDLLKNNGLLFIEVPNCQNPSELQFSIDTQPHISHFTKHNLETLGKKCGFSVLSNDVFRFDVVSIPQHFKYLLKWIFKLDYYKKDSEIHGNRLRILLKKS